MGEIWREELEIPDLENEVMKLYKEIEPLYVLLHAVVRHKLLLQFGTQHVDPKGPIPMHLLGKFIINVYSFSYSFSGHEHA